MRTSRLVTMSLPPKMLAESGRVAKRKNMNRSELLRTALRAYLEEVRALDAVNEYRKEKNNGKLKILKGSLADLM